MEPHMFLFHRSGQPDVPTRPDTWTHRHIKLRDSLGLVGVRLHDIRHYVGTELLAQGFDPVTVAGRLGHSRVTTTLDIYAHFRPANDRLAAEALGRALSD